MSGIPPMGRIRGLVVAARPRQWVKNLLVFAAPGAAGVLDDAASLGKVAVVFAAFCLSSSGTYYWNDLLDVEAATGERRLAAVVPPTEPSRANDIDLGLRSR